MQLGFQYVGTRMHCVIPCMGCLLVCVRLAEPKGSPAARKVIYSSKKSRWPLESVPRFGVLTPLAPLGQMKAHIDFETRSTVNLTTVGLDVYAKHPTTDVWCLAYAYDDRDPVMWLPGDPITDLAEHVAIGGLVYAHNASFEIQIWNEIMVPRYGWPELRPEQCRCTAAMAYAMALPGSLDGASKAVGLPYEKDAAACAEELGRLHVLHICGDTSMILEDLLETGSAGFELDYRTDTRKARDVMKGRAVFFGNIDPSGVLALGSPDKVAKKTRELLDLFAGNPRFVLNSGCALPATTPLDNIRAMIKEARR